MEFHEKTLELNITHELLNLADTWYWFLTDIPLWRYFRPRYRLPFLKFPKSTAGGFHITTEGKNDPTGEKGGGYDVRINCRGHLLFIQYKKGDFITTSPSPKSIFNTAPHEHFAFQINSTSTNQHFVLRDLAAGIGAKKHNAVVYAFPLIADMNELEDNAGKLIRRTKFISIADIDSEATKAKVTISRDQEHKFRVDKTDMKRCEMNYYYYYYYGKDWTPEIIADIIAIRFEKTIRNFIVELQNNFKLYNLYPGYIGIGLQQAFHQFQRYLLHYFEVNPTRYLDDFYFRGIYPNLEYREDEFSDYDTSPRDIEIVTAVFYALSTFSNFIAKPYKDTEDKELLISDVPIYEPLILLDGNEIGNIEMKFGQEYSKELIEGISYLTV